MRAGLARHTRRQGLSISRRSTHLKSFICGAVDRAYPPAAKSTVELAIPDGEEGLHGMMRQSMIASGFHNPIWLR